LTVPEAAELVPLPDSPTVTPTAPLALISDPPPSPPALPPAAPAQPSAAPVLRSDGLSLDHIVVQGIPVADGEQHSAPVRGIPLMMGDSQNSGGAMRLDLVVLPIHAQDLGGGRAEGVGHPRRVGGLPSRYCEMAYVFKLSRIMRVVCAFDCLILMLLVVSGTFFVVPLAVGPVLGIMGAVRYKAAYIRWYMWCYTPIIIIVRILASAFMEPERRNPLQICITAVTILSHLMAWRLAYLYCACLTQLNEPDRVTLRAGWVPLQDPCSIHHARRPLPRATQASGTT